MRSVWFYFSWDNQFPVRNAKLEAKMTGDFGSPPRAFLCFVNQTDSSKIGDQWLTDFVFWIYRFSAFYYHNFHHIPNKAALIKTGTFGPSGQNIDINRVLEPMGHSGLSGYLRKHAKNRLSLRWYSRHFSQVQVGTDATQAKMATYNSKIFSWWLGGERWENRD